MTLDSGNSPLCWAIAAVCPWVASNMPRYEVCPEGGVVMDDDRSRGAARTIIVGTCARVMFAYDTNEVEETPLVALIAAATAM